MEDAEYRTQREALGREYLGLGNRAMSQKPGSRKHKINGGCKMEMVYFFRKGSYLGSSTQSRRELWIASLTFLSTKPEKWSEVLGTQVPDP